MNLSPTVTRLTNTSPESSRFDEVLASASGQAETSSNGFGVAVPRAQMRTDSEADTARTPTQTEMGTSPGSGTGVNQDMPQITSAAAGREDVLQAASSTVQARSGKSEASPAPGRDTKSQSRSGEIALPVAPRNALPSSPELGGAFLPIRSSQSSLQAEAKPSARLPLQSIDGTSGAPVESTGNRVADAAHIEGRNQDKLQASDAKTAGGEACDTGACTAAQPVETQSCSLDAASGFALSRGLSAAPDAADSMVPLSIVSLPGTGNGVQLPGDASKGNEPADATLPKGPTPVSAAGNAKDKESTATTGTSAASAQSPTSSNQTVQRPDANLSQSGPAAPRSENSVSPQIQVIASQGALHNVGPSAGHAESAAEPSRSGGQPAPVQTADNAAGSVVNTANLVQKMSETEMSVVMHSTEYGAISIRTSISEQQMTAQISIDHGDLGRALSAHIPAMEAKLGGDLGVRALVEVNQTAMSFSGERGNSPQREQQNFAKPLALNDGAPVVGETDYRALHLATGSGGNYRLDIRA